MPTASAKLYLLLISNILLMWGNPLLLYAHGGVEKTAGGVVIVLKQDPISPLVGEKVKMNFVFIDKDNRLERYPHFPVTLSLIDTYYGDESKDVEILRRTLKTDINGSLDFEYTFKRENYFDINFTFKDPTTKNLEETGFLIQARDSANLNIVEKDYKVTYFVILILISALLLIRTTKRK